MKREEFFNTVTGCKEYLLIEKENRYNNIKELLEFVDNIEFTKSDINNMGIDCEFINEVKKQAEIYLDRDIEGDVINIDKYKDYNFIFSNLLAIINSCIPNNYFIENDKDKIIIKQIQSFWGM